MPRFNCLINAIKYSELPVVVARLKFETSPVFNRDSGKKLLVLIINYQFRMLGNPLDMLYGSTQTYNLAGAKYFTRCINSIHDNYSS